ncbi:hypothetical protein Tco_1216532 [Tanacetum coccineum]
MEEEQNQPEVMQELLLKLMDDLQILKGKARDNFLKDVCIFLRKFSRIPFGVMPKVLSIAWERFFFFFLAKLRDALTDKQYQQEDIQELMSKLLEDVRNIREELSKYINCPSWNRPTFYDNDDDEYTIIYSKPKAITPDLPIEVPDNSLSMGDEHLDTIPSTENLVPIPSELEGISDDTCDMRRLIEPDQGRLSSIVISDNLNEPLLELPEFESFHFDLYDDPSFPRPPPEPPDIKNSLIIETNAPVINNFDELNEDECFNLGGGKINFSQNVEVDNYFTFVTRTFLPYLTYPEVSPLLSSNQMRNHFLTPKNYSDIST